MIIILNRKLKILTLLLVLLFCDSIYAQDTLKIFEIIPPKIKRGLTHDTQELSNALVEGKKNETEKFEAIFSWVVTNISYNTRMANSGKSFSSERSTKNVLRSRSGICSDYAKLMDELCYHAGIQSTTINGYAKEIIFDVDDPLFVDNHVWNAVKLNGNWHLYDATWSAGRVTYEYTKCSLRRIKWIEKQYNKTKIRKLDLIVPKKKDAYCGLPSSTILSSTEIRTIPLFPRFLLKILYLFPFRIKEVYRSVVNFDYYLTSPEVFSLDHFPTDPVWALNAPIKNTTDFSEDKTFYERNGSEFSNMSRIGQTCIPCDDLLKLDSIAKIKRAILSSRATNKKNHLLPGNENLKLASIYYKEILAAKDSVSTINWADSTLNYLEESYKDYQKIKPLNSQEYSFHAKKNNAKKRLLLGENKDFYYAAKKEWQAVSKRNIKIKSLVAKAKFYKNRNTNEGKQIHRTLNYKYHLKVVNQVRIESLTKKFENTEAKSEKLTIQINELQDSLVAHFTLLWYNLLDETNVLDPLLAEWKNDDKLRSESLMDSYDREIKEIRAKMLLLNENLMNSIDVKILFLADQVYSEFKELNLLIKQRNRFYNYGAKTLAELYTGKAIGKDSLLVYETVKRDRINTDNCWNSDNSFLIKALVRNFKTFEIKSRYYFRSVNNNNKTEFRRYTKIQKYIARKRTRLNHATDNNKSVNRKVKKDVLEYRKSYLKKLKEARKKKRKE